MLPCSPSAPQQAGKACRGRPHTTKLNTLVQSLSFPHHCVTVRGKAWGCALPWASVIPRHHGFNPQVPRGGVPRLLLGAPCCARPHSEQ